MIVHAALSYSFQYPISIFFIFLMSAPTYHISRAMYRELSETHKLLVVTAYNSLKRPREDDQPFSGPPLQLHAPITWISHIGQNRSGRTRKTKRPTHLYIKHADGTPVNGTMAAKCESSPGPYGQVFTIERWPRRNGAVRPRRSKTCTVTRWRQNGTY